MKKIFCCIMLYLFLFTQLFTNIYLIKSKIDIEAMSEKDKHDLYLSEDYLMLWKDIDKDLVVDCSGPFSDEIRYSVNMDNFAVYRYYSDWQDQYLSYMLIDLGDGFIARTMMFESEEDIKVWDENEKEYQINCKDNQYEVNQQLETVCPMNTQEIIYIVNESKTQYFLLLEKVNYSSANEETIKLAKANIICTAVEVLLCVCIMVKKHLMRMIRYSENIKYDKIMKEYIQAVEVSK